MHSVLRQTSLLTCLLAPPSLSVFRSFWLHGSAGTPVCFELSGLPTKGYISSHVSIKTMTPPSMSVWRSLFLDAQGPDNRVLRSPCQSLEGLLSIASAKPYDRVPEDCMKKRTPQTRTVASPSCFWVANAKIRFGPYRRTQMICEFFNTRKTGLLLQGP